MLKGPLMRSARVDYDTIAELYDETPHRTKEVDPEFLDLVGERGSSGGLAVLDIGCGTGNQLIANSAAYNGVRLVGVDRFSGMLTQARRKAADISWVQADGSALPFRPASFDLVTCQFGLHHIADKRRHLGDVVRVLKPGGRLITKNVSPHDSPDWLFYTYFPEALAIDLRDFWSPEQIAAEMHAAGFDKVAVDRQHLRFQQNLRTWYNEVRRRSTCSQLLAIPDAAYEAGLRRLSREIEASNNPLLRDNQLCLVTIRGEKRPGRTGGKPRQAGSRARPSTNPPRGDRPHRSPRE
jgi:SAM-dependent methyltransferase